MPRWLAVDVVNVHYFHSCFGLFFISQAVEVCRQRLSKVQAANDRDL